MIIFDIDNKNYKAKVNRYFYKIWKDSSKDWRRINLHAHHKFYILSKLSEKCDMYIYEIVAKLLLEEKLYGYLYEKKIIENIYKMKLSNDEYEALLGISGYEYNKLAKSYYCNEERAYRILNLCDHARNYSDDIIVDTIKFKFKNSFKNIFYRINARIIRIIDWLSIDTESTALRIEPANGERRSKIFCFVISLMVLVGIIFCFLLFTHKIDLNAIFCLFTKEEFLSSFIGACIPGIVTIVTTFLIINHSYKVDYHRERMGALPLFTLSNIQDKQTLVDEYGSWDKSKNSSEVFTNTAETDDLNLNDVIILKLVNKGQGMAFNVYRQVCKMKFDFGDFSQNQEHFIALRKGTISNYVLSFMDMYGNKYTQRFYIKSYSDGKDEYYGITTYPPELVLRTKLIRYQQ